MGKKYGNLAHIQPIMAKVTPSGGLVFAADFGSEGGGDVSHFYGEQDMWICNIDANSNIIWETTLGNQHYNKIGALLVKDNGNVIVLGETDAVGGMVECNFHTSSTGYYRDYWISELNQNGEILWQECYGGSHHEQGFDIIEENGGYTLLGTTYSNDGDVSGNNGYDNNDIWLMHIDEAGNLEWQNCFGGTDSDSGIQLFKTEDNGYVLVGNSNSNDGDVSYNHCWPTASYCDYDAWVVVTDPNRNILWEKTFGGLQNGTMSRNSAVQLGEMDFIITSQKSDMIEEYGEVTADFDCTPYPIEHEYSAWIFRLYDPTIGATMLDNNSQSLEVYPNPAFTQNQIFFELPEHHQEIEIQIFDVYGKEIAKLKVWPQQTQVLWELEHINAGVYFYRAEIGPDSSREVYRGKVILN